MREDSRTGSDERVRPFGDSPPVPIDLDHSSGISTDIDDFRLRSLLVDRNVGNIAWSVGSDIPLGTDTFVVTNGKIVSQTFAMHSGAAR